MKQIILLFIMTFTGMSVFASSKRFDGFSASEDCGKLQKTLKDYGDRLYYPAQIFTLSKSDPDSKLAEDFAKKLDKTVTKCQGLKGSQEHINLLISGLLGRYAYTASSEEIARKRVPDLYKACEFKPNQPTCALELGDLLAEMGKYSDAFKMYDFSRTFGEDDYVNLAQAKLLLQKSNASVDEKKKASSYLDLYIKKHPTNEEAKSLRKVQEGKASINQKQW